jgi:hypothetical protein
MGGPKVGLKWVDWEDERESEGLVAEKSTSGAVEITEEYVST